ncbi:MAG: hypothetical protein KGL34_13375 [Gammaproteobacteria bacterium]|nr:hypothetical protein [Gammaproteobacteria bacterium]
MIGEGAADETGSAPVSATQRIGGGIHRHARSDAVRRSEQQLPNATPRNGCTRQHVHDLAVVRKKPVKHVSARGKSRNSTLVRWIGQPLKRSALERCVMIRASIAEHCGLRLSLVSVGRQHLGGQGRRRCRGIHLLPEKNSAVGRSRLEEPEDLHRTLLGRLRYLQKSPERIRSFFQMPETKYAA